MIARPALLRRLEGYASVTLGSLGLPGERALRGPIYAQVSVADPCNHRCVMCPYHPPEARQRDVLPKFGDTAPGVMSLDTFRAVAEDLATLGTRRVDLVGRGEPLLNPDAARMVELAHRLGLEVTLTTNGSKLDEATARALVAAGLDQLKVSLNAGRAETYEKIHVTESEERFAAVLEGVRRVTRARGARPHVTLSFAISSLNGDELSDMVGRAVEVGADAAYFQHLIPVPERPGLSLDGATLRRLSADAIPAALARASRAGIETNLRSFAEEARRMLDEPAASGAVPCYVGYYFTVVLGNGHVMPCCQIERPLGSVEDTPLRELWNGPSYRAFRRAARRLPVRQPELDTAECERCYFRPHNVTVHRLVRPLSAARGGAFSIEQARRLLRLDSDHEERTT